MLTDPCILDDGISSPCFTGVTCKKVTDIEYACGACPRGLSGHGRGSDGCQPVDECKEASPCFPGALCVDLLQGYQCQECPAGYTGQGIRGHDINDTQVLQQVRSYCRYECLRQWR